MFRHSRIQQLALQVRGTQSGQQSAHPTRKLLRMPSPHDDDASVRSAGFKPLTMEALEVNSVVGNEDAVSLSSESELL